MPGAALRAQRRPHGEQQTPILENVAAWLAVAWPVGGPDNRHSRRVALLKRVLPAISVVLLLAIALWPRLAPLWERMRFSFPAIDLREGRELRMINPRYAGIDRVGRPFVVTAASGRQVPDRQDLMSLQAPRDDMKTHSGADVVVTAATGIYQSQNQLLDLFGDVTLIHQNGTRIVTPTARVDAANNTAEGSDPVEGHGPSGDVKAQGFRILDKGDTILFTGQSELLLNGAKPAAKQNAPAALPAPIAATAAQVAAEAKPMLAAAAAAAPAARQHPATRHAAAHPGTRAHAKHPAGKTR